MNRTCVISVLLAAMLSSPCVAGAQNVAATAWREGDFVTAERLYANRLASDSLDVRALHRMGLIFAWSERYAQSLALFDKLERVAPRNLDARVDRARVLAWSGQLEAATDALDTLVAEFPDHRASRVELARFLTWRGHSDSARAIYASMLVQDSTDLDALRGAAQVAAWSGDLLAGEAGWYRVLAADSTDVPALTGLAQTLRWQGRHAAASEVLERIPPDERSRRDVSVELQAVHSALAPRTGTRFDYEADSDGNRIGTLAFQGAWHPIPRIEIRGDAYLRRASQASVGAPAQGSRGFGATLRALREPGWLLWLGAGFSHLDGAARATVPVVRAGVSSPNRSRIGWSVQFEGKALDATAVLIDRGITVTEIATNVRAEPAPRWALAAGVSRADFDGVESNRRVAGYVVARWRFTNAVRLGTRLRAFGFSSDLQEGYFDPSFFGLAEGIVSWQHDHRSVRLEAEVAPGLQQIESGTDIQTTLRGNAAISYEPAPGRRVGLSALYTTSGGLQGLATGGDGYRYVALGITGTWVF